MALDRILPRRYPAQQRAIEPASTAAYSGYAMRIVNESIQLSASDLTKHLGCAHLTELDRAVAEGRLEPPAWRDPALAVLQERGLAHEQAYVADLREQGLDVVELRDVEPGAAIERTREAMRSGADIVVQAALRRGPWIGFADVLRRIELPSELGGWSYEVVDTKLAQETRGATVLQLCLYSDLLSDIQGLIPERMHVVKPGAGFPQESFRFEDFHAYYRLVRGRLLQVIEAGPSNSTYPDPVLQCEMCSWWAICDARRRADDHLCLVAGIRSLHIGELQSQGVQTLEQFATAETPLPQRPARGSLEAYAKAQEQARVQLRGRQLGQPIHELLPPEPDRGLALLPEPSPGDVFLDFEGDPFVAEDGLEYLLGFAYVGDDGAFIYRGSWAASRAAEKRAFEDFIDFVMSRLEQYPAMHVYHFSPYEPATLKRLMGRHATREAEVDSLLRGERLIDLHAVVRQGVRASVESYSLKELERFSEFSRAVELPRAAAAIRRVQRALEFGAHQEISDEDRQSVEGYNRDDCLSTAALRDWLEGCRRRLINDGHALPRPPLQAGEASEAVEDRAQEAQIIFEQLTSSLTEDRESWGSNERAQWLLAHLLEYFRREDKAAWWEFFRLHQLEEEELLDERKAATGLRFVAEVGGTSRCPVHRYSFPPQEVSLDSRGALHEVRGAAVGTLDSIDPAARTIDIKKRADAAANHPRSILVNERVTPQPLDTSLLDLGRHVAQHGVDAPGRFRAARDLLLRKEPRLIQPGAGGPLRPDGEDILQSATRIASNLDDGLLAIQGPPGTGKTYVGARMIASLARSGKRVGVTAVSHKVIRNLLNETLRAAIEAGEPLQAVHKVSEKSDDLPDALNEVTDSGKALAALDEGLVVGGTAWLWARDDAAEILDYLFIDEAGQLSLAQALAAARSARNIVLLGDPQQLKQPKRGAHPEGAEVSALDHLLEGRETIPDTKGLFLGVTRRLHPDICRFTSEVYYEGRLESLEGLERQALHGITAFAGSGLFYVPVTHTGNQNSSLDEAEAISQIVSDLLSGRVEWTDQHGARRSLRDEDILIVAPYNAQVALLAERLPDVRVGTVDKFQGQEAPVVIYSMATSTPDDAPRGMSFLYDPNRLNVATSRARCVCLLVAAPAVLSPDCRSPEHMHWANGLCRFRELASVVELPVGQSQAMLA